MRRFPLEPVFWRSLLHACLRCLGLSRKRAYRVMVLAEPVWLADAETGVLGSFGVFTTRAVVADSESSAR